MQVISARLYYIYGLERPRELINIFVLIRILSASFRSVENTYYIYWVFLLFHFRDTHLEVPLISMNMDHLELRPESYKLSMENIDKMQGKQVFFFRIGLTE